MRVRPWVKNNVLSAPTKSSFAHKDEDYDDEDQNQDENEDEDENEDKTKTRTAKTRKMKMMKIGGSASPFFIPTDGEYLYQ